MNKIQLIGLFFAKDGGGTSEMNFVFREYLSKEIPLESIEILALSRDLFPGINRIIARNLVLLRMKKIIENNFIHVMHTMELCCTIPLVDISKYSKKRIVTVHDFYPFEKRPGIGFASRTDNFLKRRCYDFLPLYDHIFARTVEISRSLQNNYHIDKEKITVQGPIIEEIYSPMNVDRNSDGKVIIGYMNNFTWNKARMLLEFIKAFKKVKNKDMEFHIYGRDFPYMTEISDDSRIKYHGFLDDSEIVSVTAQFDAYLSTSEYEGFGIPIAKAKAMKIPVLCFDGDVPNIMKKNTCVWNKDNLINILENESWNHVNVSNAYKDVEPLRPEAVIKQTLRVYNDVFKN